jgi:curved DNA-binding protein CbpA
VFVALGVPEDASAEAIEGAYRERVKEVIASVIEQNR